MENTERVNLHLPNGYKDLLQTIAKDKDMSVNALIRQQVKKLLKEEGLI